MINQQRQFPHTRLRRLRQNTFIRKLSAETTLTTHDLIYPVFLTEGKSVEPISAMPGIQRWTLDALLNEAKVLSALGIPAIALFPVIDLQKKTVHAEEAYHPDGLIPQAIRSLKANFPDLGIISDIALDPYTSHGQDGLINAAGEILNDETIVVLIKQALAHAEAGVDIIAPSDMMDGRIGQIRSALEKSGFKNTMILSYAAKYASCFYHPFRHAVGSEKNLAQGQKSKASYQMNVCNTDEALHEVALDLNEGADMVMVKPGLLSLDVIYRVKQLFHVPTFAYQVSGEYAMLTAAAEAGYLDKKSAVLESLLSIKRAGADAIFTYFAKDVAGWLAETQESDAFTNA